MTSISDHNTRPFPVRKLHDWYRRSRRILPWREDPAPYKVWVSEIMLQQTQVQNVIPYFERFMKRFPTLQSLARADQDEVLAQWSGLGYYSRARNLHKTARIVMEKFNGKFPDDRAGMESLPGVGPYTAGAVLSIAFNKPESILDGNVRRVMARVYLSNDADVLWKKSAAAVVLAHAKKIPPSDFNQAVMELGALVCLPRNPSCQICPLGKECGANLNRVQEEYPAVLRRTKTVKQFFVMLVAVSNGRVLLRKRSQSLGRMAGMWEFPMVEVGRSAAATQCKAWSKRFGSEMGFPVSAERGLGRLSHHITHHALDILVVRGSVHSGAALKKREFRWVRPTEIGRFSTSSLVSKALALTDGF